MITDTTSPAQRTILRTLGAYVAHHPIAILPSINDDGTVNAHLIGDDPRAEHAAVNELADLLHLDARVQLDGRYAAFSWPGQNDDIQGFELTEWSATNVGQVVVWSGRAPKAGA